VPRIEAHRDHTADPQGAEAPRQLLARPWIIPDNQVLSGFSGATKPLAKPVTLYFVYGRNGCELCNVVRDLGHRQWEFT
jgi:hypothetical protein